MAVWSKVLLLTASYLSPLPGFKPLPGHVGKLPVTWGQAMAFTQVSGTPNNWLISHDLDAIRQKK